VVACCRLTLFHHITPKIIYTLTYTLISSLTSRLHRAVLPKKLSHPANNISNSPTPCLTGDKAHCLCACQLSLFRAKQCSQKAVHNILQTGVFYGVGCHTTTSHHPTILPPLSGHKWLLIPCGLCIQQPSPPTIRYGTALFNIKIQFSLAKIFQRSGEGTKPAYPSLNVGIIL
jgi:hypothetical protein